MFTKKKILIVFPILIAVIFSFSSLAFANGDKEAKVIGDNLNVRISPNLSAEILTKLPKGIKVKVLGESGDWYNISYEEITGWVFGQYLSFEDKPIGVGIINGSNVNVRSTPEISSGNIITQANRGDTFDVYECSGDWYRIQLSGQKFGWVFKDYIIVRDSVSSRGSGGQADRDSGSGSTKGQQIVEYAKRFLGVKYRYGKASPSEGFDCSGFVYYVFKHFGINLQRSSKDQAKYGVRVDKKDLKAGDLVFFDTNGGLNAVNHVGIYIGNGKFIHASSGSSAKKVVISDMSSGFYAKCYMTARRYI
ncbi:MAG TPA: SH3 domain-containing protein [Clostridiaceae bacterium]|nr:SH3 domain-containing protein [Clostridiaceae bacterium]